MFAPPPVQMSRAELERRKKRRQSAGGHQNNASRSSFSAGSDGAESLHRTESNTSSPRDVGSPAPSVGRKGGWFFGARGGGDKAATVSSHSPLSVSPGPPPEPPKQQQHPGDRAARKLSGDREKPKKLSEAFGERPRKAPVPPKRPPRPSSEVLPLVPGAFPTTPSPGAFPSTPPPQRPVPLVPAPEGPPPPVPDKSPKRLAGVGRESGLIDPFAPFAIKPLSTASSLNEALAAVRLQDGDTRVQTARASPTMGRSAKLSPTKAGGSGAKPPHRLSGNFGGKIEKKAVAEVRRSSAAANLKSAFSDLEDMKTMVPPGPPRRATDTDLHYASANELSWKRRHKGETMSMLLNDGFFPVQEYIYNHKNPNISVRVPFPPPLNLLHKDLPDTPSSIVPTPTELYQFSPDRPTRPPIRQRKSGSKPKRRSPLAPISVTDAKNNSTHLPPGGFDQEVSPSRLSAIPEGSSVSENTPPGSVSGVSTPLATKIHLRGGSVITLSPPELTAWKQTYYLQGPIKLPKPTILPRKGSTASMEAFQDVVDQVYQEALCIPRRRSDDKVVDDICEFFDDFCFEELGFGDGVLGVLDVKMGDIAEEMEEMGAETERFATPPNEMVATPVEKVIAKDIVEHTITLPPIETEALLRARGIARLSAGAPPSPTSSSRRASTSSRKDSAALSTSDRKDPAALGPFPGSQSNMLEVPGGTALPILSKSREDVRMQDRSTPRSPVDQGMDWDDGVEELDRDSVWVAPAAVPKKQKGAKETKNPMKRMRRFVATASAIL